MASQNRYKLTKRYRSLVEQHGSDPDDPEVKRALGVAKVMGQVLPTGGAKQAIRVHGCNYRDLEQD